MLLSSWNYSRPCRAPEAAGRLRELAETGALHEHAIYPLDALEYRALVGREHPALAHDEPSRHDHVAYVVTGRLVDEAIDRHVHGGEMRLREIHRDEIGLLPGFHRTQLAVETERLVAIHGGHFERLAGRY